MVVLVCFSGVGFGMIWGFANMFKPKICTHLQPRHLARATNVALLADPAVLPRLRGRRLRDLVLVKSVASLKIGQGHYRNDQNRRPRGPSILTRNLFFFSSYVTLCTFVIVKCND